MDEMKRFIAAGFEGDAENVAEQHKLKQANRCDPRGHRARLHHAPFAAQQNQGHDNPCRSTQGGAQDQWQQTNHHPAHKKVRPWPPT